MDGQMDACIPVIPSIRYIPEDGKTPRGPWCLGRLETFAIDEALP